MKVIPFLNGTEAGRWMFNNCEDCKTRCYYEKNMAFGFISGDITLNTAEFIGYEFNGLLKDGDYVHLFNVCQNKNKVYKKKRVKKSNDPTLFESTN